jgi:hypothetical protein
MMTTRFSAIGITVASSAIVMTIGASDVRAQEVIYARAPATVAGVAASEGQKVAPQARIETGPGGVVVVEMQNWPATKDGPCTLFLIASGGRGTTIPRRASAQPEPCGNAIGASLDNALQGTAVLTSVLLFPPGKSDGGGLTEAVIYDRLAALRGRRGRGRGAQAAAAGRGGRGRAGAGTAVDLANRLTVQSATYGGNCGAPSGNATSHIGAACNGRTSCDYTIDYQLLGDPAPGCAKTYRVVYTCGGGVPVKVATIAAEAGFKQVAKLACQ